MAASFTHTCIATAGLDLLHTTRLKVACSLLMADRVVAELAPWPRQGAGVLVASLDEVTGATAAVEGRAAGITVLTLSRGHGSDAARLRHGATVREIFDQLREVLLAAPVSSAAAPTVVTLFDALATTTGDLVLLERAGTRVVFERAVCAVHVAHEDAATGLATAAGEGGWQAQAMTAAELQHERPQFACTVELETLVWQAAAACRKPVGRLPTTARVALAAWPAITAGAVPATWLLPLALLLRNGWTAEALAATSGLSIGDVSRIFAALQHSGLLRTLPAAPDRPDPPVRAAGGFLLRVARRFGMHFGGKA